MSIYEYLPENIIQKLDYDEQQQMYDAAEDIYRYALSEIRYKLIEAQKG